MVLKNSESQSWGGIEGVTLWITTTTGYKTHRRQGVCVEEEESGGVEGTTGWLLCPFRHQNERPSSKRRNPAQCPGQGHMVNTVLLMSTPLWKQWLKDTVLVWAQLQGVWDTCTGFHQGTYLRVCISILHDTPPILIHGVVALAFHWELSFDVLWSKDWLQVEPRALTVQPLL